MDAILPKHVQNNIIPEPNSGCWFWLGTMNSYGYGVVGVSPEKYVYEDWLAHRYVYTKLRCEIPDGLDLDHLCRMRCCVNPEHLEPVTRRVNLLRGKGLTAKWAARTHCENGHPFTGEVNSEGRRFCRLCQRERHSKEAAQRKEARHARGLMPPWQTLKTTCPKGHFYNEENTRITKLGHRICRACQREHKRRKPE